MKHVIIFVIAVLIGTTAFAQPEILWTRTYGGVGSDVCSAMQETSDGGYILAGSTESFGAGMSDLWLLKTDANGDSLWSRTYGGSGNDVCSSMQQTSDGGYILAGSTNSFGPDSIYGDIWLVKVDANGDSVWSRTFGGEWIDEAAAVQQTTDGGYVVAGNKSWDWGGLYNIWLLKTDANGDSLWSRTYGDSGSAYCSALDLAADGGYVLTGGSMLLKIDANGDTLWSSYGGGNTVRQTSDGGYVVAGGGDVSYYNFSFMDLGRFDANGSNLWWHLYRHQDYYTGSGAYAVHESSDGGYAMAGSLGFQAMILKTDANGDSLWSLTFGEGSLHAVVQTGDGGYAVAGTSYANGFFTPDMWLARLGPELAAPQHLTIRRENENVRLDWNAVPGEGILYIVYGDSIPDGTFDQLLGSTSDTSFVDTAADGKKFYVVRAARP